MLDRVQNLLVGMEERIGDHLRTLATKLDSLLTKVDSLDAKVGSLHSKVDSLHTKVDSIARKLTLNNELLGPLTLENPPAH